MNAYIKQLDFQPPSTDLLSILISSVFSSCPPCILLLLSILPLRSMHPALPLCVACSLPLSLSPSVSSAPSPVRTFSLPSRVTSSIRARLWRWMPCSRWVA